MRDVNNSLSKISIANNMTSPSISSRFPNDSSASELLKMAHDFNSFESSLGSLNFRKPSFAPNPYPRKHSKGGIVKGLNSQEGGIAF